VYSTSSCSTFSSVSKPQTFSIYSKAFNKDKAPFTFGVPGSKRNGKAPDLKQFSFTSLIAHPQEKIG
jgi:hypothetical protein